MCSLLGMRILLITAPLREWWVVKEDTETAFIQTCPAQRQVLVVPPAEYANRRNDLWLMLAAAYAVINYSVKCHRKSDDAFKIIEMEQIEFIPQLGALHGKTRVVILFTCTLVYDIFLTGTDDQLRYYMTELNNIFRLGETLNGTGPLRFSGMNLKQADDISISIHADDKLTPIETNSICQRRRRQAEETINEIKAKAFLSIIFSNGLLFITVPPL